jgi:hypothetical protein
MLRPIMGPIMTGAVAACLAASPLMPLHAYADSDADRAARHAAQLREQAGQTAGELGSARTELATLAVQASAALDAYQTAHAKFLVAMARVADTRRHLNAATAKVERQRTAIANYLAQVYRTGVDPGLTMIIDLVTGEDPTGLLSSAGALNTIGDRQAQDLTSFRTALLDQQQAQNVADQATAAARHAALLAQRAKKQAHALVQRQRQEISQLNAQLAKTRTAAQRVEERAKRLRLRELIAAQGPLGSCKGGDVSGYSNGHLPESALCPLWGAPGQQLRADAAAAFNRMSKAYAGEFGAPICVTDSYRSYDQQVQVYSEKPGLAAHPGTSQHGWGLAVDLCGNVANDGTEENTWLRGNSSRFSWFHPSWAEHGGSGAYEPWHWEFAG